MVYDPNFMVHLSLSVTSTMLTSTDAKAGMDERATLGGVGVSGCQEAATPPKTEEVSKSGFPRPQKYVT